MKGFFVLQDLGDYKEEYYSVHSTEGEQIQQLIAGYIDIIVRKVSYLTICLRSTLCIIFTVFLL